MQAFEFGVPPGSDLTFSPHVGELAAQSTTRIQIDYTPSPDKKPEPEPEPEPPPPPPDPKAKPKAAAGKAAAAAPVVSTPPAEAMQQIEEVGGATSHVKGKRATATSHVKGKQATAT